MNDSPKARLSAEERRESILEAATVVFGERGYAGATTDAVAKAAGISQAYVVRTFGSKEQLFIAACDRARARIIDGFRRIIATFPPDASPSDKIHALGDAYVTLMADRGILLTTMHLYTLGAHPTLGPHGRKSILEVYRVARDEAGLDADTAMKFFAHGMLMNQLLALRMSDAAHEDPLANELLQAVFAHKADEVRQLVLGQTRLADQPREG